MEKGYDRSNLYHCLRFYKTYPRIVDTVCRQSRGFLKTETIYLSYDWDLTEEEGNRFEESEIGDAIHIETPMMPVLLDAQDAIGIPIFSSILEIPENYRRKKAITERDLNHLIALIKAVKSGVNREIIIVIDMFDDICAEIDSKDFIDTQE